MKYYKTQNGIRAIGEKGDNSGLDDQSKLIQKDWIEISYNEMMTITITNQIIFVSPVGQEGR